MTSGLPSSNLFQNLIPQCTVTVYLTGTTTLATIYHDAAATPLTNPFKASTKAQWLFFAADNQGYDVVMSAGIPPLTYTIPVTLTDLVIKSGGGGSGPTIQTNNISNISQTLLNFVNPSPFNGLTFTFTNPSGGIETFGVSGTLNNPGITNPYTTVNGQTCVLGAGCTIPVGTTLTVEHNDSTTGINQGVLDFNDTNPSPPAGSLNVTFQTDSTGRLSGFVPATYPPQIQMNVPGVDSSHVFIPFTACTTSSSGVVDYNLCDALSGGAATFRGGIFGFGATALQHYINPALPSWLPAANVTSVSLVAYSQGILTTSISSVTSSCSGSGACGAFTFPPGNSQITVPVTGVTGSTIGGLVATVQLQNGPFCVECPLPITIVGQMQITQIGLLVGYSGVTAPPNNALNVDYPLLYSHFNNSLGISNYWPNGVNSEVVSDLGTNYPPTVYPGYVGDVSDLAIPYGPAIGGGTGQGRAVSNGFSYQVVPPYLGIPQGNSGVCPGAPSGDPNNGALTNLNCNFGGNRTAPTVVSSGGMAIASGTCSSGAISLTAGNALYVSGADVGASPTISDGVDTFTSVYTPISSGFLAAWTAPNIAGGTVTITITGGSCTGRWVQIAGAPASSIVDGTPVTYFSTTTPTLHTIGNLATTLGQDLILSDERVNGCAPGSTPNNYSNVITFGDAMIASAVGAGAGSYNAFWFPNAACTGSRNYAATILAIKGVPSGGSGDTITSPGSTLTVGGTSTNTTIDINLGHANSWTAKQTQPAPLFSDLTGGGTQCLQISNTGQVSGTGSVCGAGSGTVTGSGTLGYLPEWTGASSLGNSPIDDGITTAGVLTISKKTQINDPTNPSQIAISYSGHALAPGSATTAVYGVDPSGNGLLSEAGAAAGRICTSTNGVCAAGGSAIVASAEIVAFSTTPTFSTSFNVSRIVLTGNITSFTMTGAADGQDKTLCFKQGSGPFTVAPPASVHGFFTVGTTNADWNCQAFVWDNTDSIWQATGPGAINQ